MTTTTTKELHRFTFSTWSETRSNRRDRTYTVEAVEFCEAHNLALDAAEHATRQPGRAHYADLIDVDGTGKPEDCGHLEYRGRVCVSGWAGRRWNGGRLCAECAGA
jgi:hypothetical protein